VPVLVAAPVDVLVAPPVWVFVEVDELARATAGLSAVKKAMVGTSGMVWRYGGNRPGWR
jgi:hypothetical protein